MVRDRSRRRCVAGAAPRRDQLRQQLRVVHDLVRAAVVGVLVRERVEAVRAARDDLRDAGAVQRLDVLLGEHLEQVLVAHPARRVAGAPLARAEHRRVDARGVRAAARRSASSSAPARRTRPRTRPRTGPPAPGRPAAARARRGPSPSRVRADAGWPHGFSLVLDAAEHRGGLLREPRLGHHEVPAQVDDRVDVLDVDRALAHARAARHAVPHDLVGHGVRHERLELDLAGGLGDHAVAEVHDQQLRRERLAGRPRGARPPGSGRTRCSRTGRASASSTGPSAVATPKRMSSSAASRSIRFGSRWPVGPVLREADVRRRAVMMCRCLEPGR